MINLKELDYKALDLSNELGVTNSMFQQSDGRILGGQQLIYKALQEVHNQTIDELKKWCDEQSTDYEKIWKEDKDTWAQGVIGGLELLDMKLEDLKEKIDA